MNVSLSLDPPKSVIAFVLSTETLEPTLSELNTQPGNNPSFRVIMAKIFMNTSAKLNVGLRHESGGEESFLCLQITEPCHREASVPELCFSLWT